MALMDNRVFNEQELEKIKIAKEATKEALRNIAEYAMDIKENLRGVCDMLNEGIEDKEQKIKPSLIKKLAKWELKEEARIKEKENLSDAEELFDIINKKV